MSRYFKDVPVLISKETEETLCDETLDSSYQMYIGSNWSDEALFLLRNVLVQSLSVDIVSDKMFCFSMIEDEVIPSEYTRNSGWSYNYKGYGYYYNGWGVELSNELTVAGLVRTFTHIGNLIWTMIRNKLIKDSSLVIHLAKNDNVTGFVKWNTQLKDVSICYFVSCCVSGLLKISVPVMDIYKAFLKKNFPLNLFVIKSDAFSKLKLHSDFDRQSPLMEYNEVFELPSVSYMALKSMKKLFHVFAKEYMVVIII